MIMVIIGANLPLCYTKLYRLKFSFKSHKNCIAIREYCAPKIVFVPGSYREFRETGPWTFLRGH